MNLIELVNDLYDDAFDAGAFTATNCNSHTSEEKRKRVEDFLIALSCATGVMEEAAGCPACVTCGQPVDRATELLEVFKDAPDVAPLKMDANPAASAHNGWKLVPIEPTREMLDASIVAVGQPPMVGRAIYQEMLAAAPVDRPVGHTDLKPLATDRLAEWRQQHGKY